MPIIEFIVSMTQFSRRSKCSIGRHEFTRRSLGGDTEANVNIYTFNVTSVAKNPDAYSVFVTKTNFT